MKLSSLFHKYKDNLTGLVLPDDDEFIQECAKKYIIGKIKGRVSVEIYKKTAKGMVSYKKANKKYYQKSKL